MRIALLTIALLSSFAALADDDCTAIMIALNGEKKPAAAVRKPNLSKLARAFWGESRVAHWYDLIDRAQAAFTMRDTTSKEYVYKIIGNELTALGDKSVPFIGRYVEECLKSGLVPEEGAYFLSRIGETGEPARKEVFAKLVAAALNPKLTPKERETAAHMMARLKKGLVKPGSIETFLDLAADPKQSPENRLALVELATKFCLSSTEDALRDGLPYAPESAWGRLFFGGESLQGAPPATAAKLEKLLDDKDVAPQAAVALALISAKKGGYQPGEAEAEKIKAGVLNSFMSLDPTDRFYSDIALGVLVKQGKIDSPPGLFVDIIGGKQNIKLRASLLRPLADAVERYDRDRTRSGEKWTKEHGELVEKLRELLSREEIKASKHPKLPDLEKYVESQKPPAPPPEKPKWTTADRTPYLQREVVVELKDGRKVTGKLLAGGGLLSLRGDVDESAVGLDGVGDERGNTYSFSVGEVKQVTLEGKQIFVGK